MTLKECVAAAVTQAGLPLADSFEHYDFTIRAQSGPVVFISDCGGESCGECKGIGGSEYHAVKVKIKLTAFLPHKHSGSEIFEAIFKRLMLDESFSSVQLSISEAKTSTAHKRVTREAYITALQLLSDDNDSEESDEA